MTKTTSKKSNTTTTTTYNKTDFNSKSIFEHMLCAKKTELIEAIAAFIQYNEYFSMEMNAIMKLCCAIHSPYHIHIRVDTTQPYGTIHLKYKVFPP